MDANHNCVHEERFAHLESELAEVNARLESKKEDIQQIQNEKDRQQKLQMELIEKVTTVTVLLEEGQKQRTANNTKLDELEKKIDKLQDEISDYKTEVKEIKSSLSSFRNTILAAIPVISIIVGVILHFIRI